MSSETYQIIKSASVAPVTQITLVRNPRRFGLGSASGSIGGIESSSAKDVPQRRQTSSVDAFTNPHLGHLRRAWGSVSKDFSLIFCEVSVWEIRILSKLGNLCCHAFTAFQELTVAGFAFELAFIDYDRTSRQYSFDNALNLLAFVG